jgi:hypothetical protein
MRRKRGEEGYHREHRGKTTEGTEEEKKIKVRMLIFFSSSVPSV